MSVIHSSPALPGFRSAVSDGSAKYSTLRSIEYSRQGRAITASAIHSRRPAGGASGPVITHAPFRATQAGRVPGVTRPPPQTHRVSDLGEHEQVTVAAARASGMSARGLCPGQRFVGEVGRGGVVLDVAAHGARVRPAVDPADQPQGQVDPGGDALAGNQVAVDDIARVTHDCDLAAGGEGVLVGVVGGHPPSPRGPGLMQQEGSGAHAGDPGRLRRGLADPAGQGVRCPAAGARPAGYQQHIQRRVVGDGVVGNDAQSLGAAVARPDDTVHAVVYPQVRVIRAGLARRLAHGPDCAPAASRTPAMPLTIRPGNRPAGMNQARGSATKYSGDSRQVDADASAVIATWRGSSPVRRPASPRAPRRIPKAGVWSTPPAMNSRRTSAAALVSCRPHRPESAAAHAAEAARDAAARAPPATAAVCSARDPRPVRPASRATDAVNRASETAEMAWPVALRRVGPGFWVKYWRSWLGDAPGRG